MKAEDKAKELLLKFGDWTYDPTFSDERNKKFVKECALICVDEIINSNPTEYWEEIKENVGYVKNIECSVYYWQEVKKEIEKL